MRKLVIFFMIYQLFLNACLIFFDTVCVDLQSKQNY